MKRKVRLAILGTLLQGSAHAAASGAPVEPSLGKGQEKVVVAPQDISARMKTKPVGAEITNPVTKDSLMETPTESTDQSVQLRGVRG